jgi:hypothetical protein
MPELELVEERLISGKGVLRVPSSARKARYWIMYADVIRLPTNEYRELNWNPYQSLYARMTYRRDGYVQTYDYLRFTREQRTYINDITGQNLRAIKCAYEGILSTFFNLGNALNLPSISVTNAIQDYKSLALSWDEILFNCYSNTALQIRFYKLDYDVCNPGNDDSDDPPPPPPPLPLVPPGTAIGDISPPYDEGDFDDGNTDPFEGDEIPEPPPEFADCQPVRVTFSGVRPNGTIFSTTADLLAPIVDIRIFNVTNIQIFCSGLNGTPCNVNGSWVSVLGGFTQWQSVSIDNIVAL